MAEPEQVVDAGPPSPKAMAGEGTPEPEASQVPEPAPAPEPASWREGITDDKERKFAETFTSPADAVKAALAFRQKLSNAVVRPGKSADAEDIKAFHKALGVPEAPEGYAITLPETLPGGMEMDEAAEAWLGEYRTAMHGAGAPPQAVQAGLDVYFKLLGEGLEARERTATETRETTEAELTREWGNGFKANAEVARRAADAFGGERFKTFLETARVDGVQLGDHPEFLRAFAAVGRRTAEDGLHGGMSDDQVANAQVRIDELTRLQTDDPARYTSKTVQDELNVLYEWLHGSGGVVGTEGRVV